MNQNFEMWLACDFRVTSPSIIYFHTGFTLTTRSQFGTTPQSMWVGVSGAGRKSGERERSGERTFQKTLERERSVEQEAAEQERSGERVSQIWAWALSGKSAAHFFSHALPQHVSIQWFFYTPNTLPIFGTSLHHSSLQIKIKLPETV